MRRRDNNEGGLTYDDTRKRWVITATTLDGRRIYKYRKDRDKKDRDTAKEILRQLLDAVNANDTSSGQTLQEYINYWFSEIASKKLRPLTLQRYKGVIEIYILPALGDLLIDKVTPDQVQTMLNNIDQAPGTVRYVRAVLSSALAEAVKRGKLDRNVAQMVTVPRIPFKETTYLDVRQSRRFIRAARTHSLDALFCLGIGVGLRLGEALGLRWCDVDFRCGTIKVVQTLQNIGNERVIGETKTGRSRRTLPLPKFCKEALQRRRDSLAVKPADDDLVFLTSAGTSYNANNVLRALRSVLKTAKLPKIRCHDLRHSCASLLLALGESQRLIMAILGHSSIGVSMNTYSHVMPALENEAMNKLHDTLSKEPLKCRLLKRTVVLTVVPKQKTGSGKTPEPA